jgi:hypothetical protein
MVRTTEEVVFRPPGGDIEGRAFRNRVSVQARAHRFIMKLRPRDLRRDMAHGRGRVARALFTTRAWKRESENA